MTDRMIPWCKDCVAKMEIRRLTKYAIICICPVCKKEVRVEAEGERRKGNEV